LVVAHPGDPREPQREPRAVGRASLDLVVGHLDHDLRADAYRLAVVARGQRPQPLGHFGELAVGEPLERLADVREAVAVPPPQSVVGEPAAAAARAAVDGDDDAIQSLRRLDLEPALASAAGLVGAPEVFRHDALVAGSERPG